MERLFEKQIEIPHVTIQLATVKIGAVEDILPSSQGYNVCQRISTDHAPLRIGNLNASEVFVRDRSVAFMPPGQPIRVYPSAKPIRLLNCAYDKAWFEQVTSIGLDLWEKHTGALLSIKDRRLEILMQDLQAELEAPGFACEMLLEALTNMILVEVARYGQRLDARKGRGGTRQGLAPWQLRRINERLAAALESGYPGLDELARLCGISQSHLMRSFKASTGWPIHKFIAEERIRAAKDLLLVDGQNSREIAGMLGFRSPAYFATAFRRMTGKTPSEYRREARAGLMRG